MPDSPHFYMTNCPPHCNKRPSALTDQTLTTTEPVFSSPLRVLHFGRFHRDGLHSGIERHVSVLLSKLSRSIDVENLVANDCLQNDTFVAEGGYRVYRAASWGMLASTAMAPRLILKARALLRERRYDLLHLHFPDPLSHLACSVLPAHIPRVVTWHSDIVRQRYAMPVYGPWLRRFIQQVDAVIVSSPAMLTVSPYIAAVEPSRRWIIPYGLDYRAYLADEVACASASLRAALCGSQPLVLSVGRLVYYKGFEYLIEAVAGLPGVHLAIVGNGPLEHHLRALANLHGCGDRVHLLRADHDALLAAWYHACDVFCLPSVETAETFGLVQLEAMACGKAVVSTRLGTGVEFVNLDGVTGFTVQPRDVLGLRAALKRLLDEPSLRADMGRAARERALSEFSAEVMARRTLALYQEVLRRRLIGSANE